ncbi:MAG: hypothetical protein IT377_31380 [Polyangiaceae bacterium]|nr:hypothetical protein [Myxococcales bacterium]MCC6903513.1 hypothetical protein [Polyangiaceae bacterium]
MRIGPGLTLVVFALATTGCKRVSERTLRDTESRAFKAVCDRDGDCKLTLTSGDHAPDKKGLAIHTTGNLIAMCDVGESKKPDATTDCRALVCSADGDCPPMHGLKDGTCINGLCREPSASISVDDAVLLCLAGTGLGTTQPDRLAMALNCGSPCRVPTICRQP